MTEEMTKEICRAYEYGYPMEMMLSILSPWRAITSAAA